MSVEEETLAANKTVVVRFNKEVIEQGNEATLRELTFASAPEGASRRRATVAPRA